MPLTIKSDPHRTPQPHSSVLLVNDNGDVVTIKCHTRTAADLLIIALTLNAHNFTITTQEGN